MLSKALTPSVPLSQSLGFARDKRERGKVVVDPLKIRE